MRRVTNCILLKNNEILLLKKPRRGWWAIPGGKMEIGETIKEAVVREYREETGIFIKNPSLKGIFTFLMKENDKIVDEWMMFTFLATEAEGLQLKESEEGILQWHPIDQIHSLPMASGDKHILDYVIHGEGILYGTFHYTNDFQLLSYKLDPN
jgi:8-oxo-dGTP diphosphatase